MGRCTNIIINLIEPNGTMKNIKNFISHPALSQSWLAERLYGDTSNKNRKKISVKIAGLTPFNEQEISKIEEIKKDLIKNIK